MAKADNCRRIVYGALTTSMLMLTTACWNDSGTPDDGKTHLTMNWVERDQEAMSAVIAGFEEANPDIAIDVTYIPVETLPQVAVTQLTAGTAPDLIFQTGGNGLPLAVQRLAGLGYVQPVDIPSDDIPETVLAQLTYEDRAYGWPMFVLGSGGVSVNTTLAKSLDVSWPTTFSGLLDTCRSLQDQGLVAIGYQAGSPQGAYSVVGALVASTGGASPEFFSKRAAGETTFASSEEWINGMAKLDEMKDAGCFQEGYPGASPESVTKLFGDNEALAIVGGGTIRPSALEAVNSSIEIVDYPLPGTTERDTVVTVGGAGVLGINSKIDDGKLEAAQAFLSYAMKPEVTAAYGEAMLGFGTYELADPAFEFPPAYAGSTVTYRAGQTAPIVQTQFNGPDVFEAYLTCAQGLVTGQTSPADCGKSLDDAWDSDK